MRLATLDDAFNLKGESEMPSRSKSDIIHRCFAAYKAKDRKVIEDLLADDFRFTSPYDDEIDKSTYFERCWPNSERIKAHLIERIFEQGAEAFGCALGRAATMDGGQPVRPIIDAWRRLSGA
jgi:hypothetical protein